MPANVVRSFNHIRQVAPAAQELATHVGTHPIISSLVRPACLQCGLYVLPLFLFSF